MSKTLTKPAAKAELNGHSANGTSKKAERLPVMKTYKIFIGGKFPRTESGRYYQLNGADGKPLANICRSSRIDANMTGFLIHSEQQARADFEKLFITDADQAAKVILQGVRKNTRRVLIGRDARHVHRC